ncbi:MAG: site-specific integrase [Candidatus Omnitrophica bacterium]|nr:site-specific integrase [Candidatus Omnitrophota bacterium]
MSHLYRRDQIYWLAFYKNGKLYRRSLKTKDRSQAIYLKNKQDQSLIEGNNIAPDNQRNCSSLLEEYQQFNEHRRVRDVNLGTESRIKRFLSWAATLTVNRISENKLQEYLNHRINNDKISLYEANNTIINLKAWLNWAVKMQYVTDNPLRNVKKYKIPLNPKRFLSREEIEELLTAAQNPDIYTDRDTVLYPVIATAIYTGMRQAELFSLEWSDVDFTRKQITVKNKEGFTTKSKKFRVIPLHDKLRSILVPLRKEKGPCFDTTNQRRVFKRILKIGKLMGIGWHTLRHTFASHLVMNGVDLNTVKDLLGHSSITTTMIYSHLSKEHIKVAVNKLRF